MKKIIRKSQKKEVSYELSKKSYPAKTGRGAILAPVQIGLKNSLAKSALGSVIHLCSSLTGMGSTLLKCICCVTVSIASLSKSERRYERQRKAQSIRMFQKLRRKETFFGNLKYK